MAPERPDNDLPSRRNARGEATETRRDWESLQRNGADDFTERLRVNKGWLYRTVYSGQVAMVFIPGKLGA